MATLHVRNVPEPLYERLRARAEANGRSIGAEAVQMIEEALTFDVVRRSGFVGRRRRRPTGRGLFSTFTERARSVVVEAQEEARELGHDHVGTGHILVGLLRVPEGVAAAALAALGLDVERARAELERRLPRGEGRMTGQIPFRPEAKKALELALRESLALGHDYIGTEHVLLGIVGEGRSEGAQIVALVEPEAEKVRFALLHAPRGPVPSGFLVEPAPFRVVELKGNAAAWERALNDAAAKGYELVEIRENRAVLRRP